MALFAVTLTAQYPDANMLEQTTWAIRATDPDDAVGQMHHMLKQEKARLVHLENVRRTSGHHTPQNDERPTSDGEGWEG